MTSDRVFIDQNQYAKLIQEIPIERTEDPDRPQTNKEFKLYREATGKLNWLNEITRPDLFFDSFLLSFNNKDAKALKVKHIFL